MDFKKFLSKTKDGVVKHSPEILLVTGAISFIGTVVAACKATTKMEKIIDAHNEQINSVNALASSEQKEDEVEYTLEDAKRDKVIIYTKTCVRVLKEYAPAIILGSVSLISFFASYGIVHKRYVAMSAVAAGLSDTLSAYRKRVVEELGKDMDDHFLTGSDKIEVKSEKVDKKGNKNEVVDTITTLKDKNGYPIYSKFFDESNPLWNKSPSINYMTVIGIQTRANDKFHRYGKLLLNDVYQMLQMEPTIIGSKVGWFEDHGDSYVDFGIWETNERVQAFLRGYEPNVLLNFNCVPIREGDLAYA